MLATLTQILRPGIEAAVVLVAAAALSRLAQPADQVERRSRRARAAVLAPWLGFGAALLVATGLAHGISVRLLDRELVHGYSTLASLAVACVLFVALVVQRIHRVAAVFISIVAPWIILVPRALALAQMLGHEVDAMQMPADRTATVGGVALGVAVAVAAAVVFLRLATRHTVDGRRLMALPIIALVVAESSVAVNMAFILGFLPITPTLVGLAAPLMNAEDLFHYGLVGSLALAGACRLLRPVRRELDPPANAAETRLRRARSMQVRRIAAWSIAAAVLIASLGITQTVIAARAEAASALTPPIVLEPKGSEVLVTEADVSDKNLHRFAVDVDGTKVRFIVVYKGSGLFGTGLDACEICGPTGYFQRESDVICKACDVVIPSPTIGFDGGCNPIPIKYEKRDGSLVFDLTQLRAGVDEFE